jgi:hypothetical protein
MDTLKEFLVKWTIDYVRNRDLIAKNIESIERVNDGFDIHVKYKTREQFFIVKPIITDIDEILCLVEKDPHFSLVTFNTKENFDCIVNNWNNLVTLQYLSIYFVNPFSQLDKKWIIHPYTHHKICDKQSLVRGLRSMFEMVEPITEEELKKRIR